MGGRVGCGQRMLGGVGKRTSSAAPPPGKGGKEEARQAGRDRARERTWWGGNQWALPAGHQSGHGQEAARGSGHAAKTVGCGGADVRKGRGARAAGGYTSMNDVRSCVSVGDRARRNVGWHGAGNILGSEGARVGAAQGNAAKHPPARESSCMHAGACTACTVPRLCTHPPPPSRPETR